jgi:hypothetical protein
MPGASQLFLKIGFLTALLLLAVWLMIFAPWIRSDGPPWSLITNWLRRQEAMDQRNRMLERRNEVGHWRLLAKREVAIEMLQGRLRLLEAAAWFKQLDGQPADMPMRHLPGWKESSEQFCLDVIAWAREPLDPYVDPLQQVKIKQLEGQLLQYQSMPGALVLPEPPSLPFLPACPN